MRIELAKILLKKPDLILLDEPTNHMDIESIQWLEDFLINQAKAVMVISHDKTFVDNITNRTIEVTMGRIYDYKAVYSEYLELRKTDECTNKKRLTNNRNLLPIIRRLLIVLEGLSPKTEAGAIPCENVEKIVCIEVDEVDTSALKLKFPPSATFRQYPVNVGSELD